MKRVSCSTRDNSRSSTARPGLRPRLGFETDVLATASPLARPARAGDGIRTHDNDVGNVVLYQLSYTRALEPLAGRPLPCWTALPRQGLESRIIGVTGPADKVI